MADSANDVGSIRMNATLLNATGTLFYKDNIRMRTTSRRRWRLHRQPKTAKPWRSCHDRSTIACPHYT